MPTWTTGNYTWPGYSPMGQPVPSPDPTEISAGQKKAAQDEHAMWQSKDGSAIFAERFGELLWGYWKPEERRYSAWLPCPMLPEGAVKVDG